MKSIAHLFPIFHFCIMCTSKCSGSCVSSLINKEAGSKESLVELNDFINAVTERNAEAGTDKSIFMNELFNLKTQARMLLDEVNYYSETSPDGSIAYGSHIFEEPSFKERLHLLKEKISLLSVKNICSK